MDAVYHLDSVGIAETLPHRYPFLLIDRVIRFENRKSIVATKNVSMNEWFFQGHFPGRPIMPGVLILESMAQASAILARLSTDGIAKDKMIFLVGANDVKWKRQVTPGDTMEIEMKWVKKKGPLWILEGQVTVEERLVASGTIMACETP